MLLLLLLLLLLLQARRQNYVTPTSFLELLSQFSASLGIKQTEVMAARNRYVVGLEKLEFATQQVHRLQKELEALQPVLAQSQKDTADLMDVIQKARSWWGGVGWGERRAQEQPREHPPHQRTRRTHAPTHALAPNKLLPAVGFCGAVCCVPRLEQRAPCNVFCAPRGALCVWALSCVCVL